MKKQLLTLVFSAFALTCAAQPYAPVKTEFNNKVYDGGFFLRSKLATANLEGKLYKAYSRSASCKFNNPDAELKAELAKFNLAKELKTVRPDTKVVAIDYSKVRPHLSKYKVLAAVKSNVAAQDEIAAKQAMLRETAANFAVIKGKALASHKLQYKINMLGAVKRALSALRAFDYKTALEITKQALAK
jgi:hypothetical protein